MPKTMNIQVSSSYRRLSSRHFLYSNVFAMSGR